MKSRSIIYFATTKTTTIILSVFFVALVFVVLTTQIQSQHAMAALPKNIIAAAFKPLSEFSGQSQVDVYKKYLDSSDTTVTFTPWAIINSNGKQLPGSKTIEVGSIAKEKNQISKWKGSIFKTIAFDIEGASKDSCPYSIQTIQQASQIAHNNGFKFTTVPGVGCNSASKLTAFAKVSDMVILQAEGHQGRGATVWKNFVTSSISAIKAGKTGIPIIIEVAVSNDSGYNHVSYLESLYSSVASQVNGIHVWFSDNHPGELKQADQILGWFVNKYG